METIRNYLETMFANMPNTPEVRRAKDELLQMMEDKYNELKSEGKTENEAVGIVISEFGNIDELIDYLKNNKEEIKGLTPQGEQVFKNDDFIQAYIGDDHLYLNYLLLAKRVINGEKNVEWKNFQ